VERIQTPKGKLLVAMVDVVDLRGKRTTNRRVWCTAASGRIAMAMVAAFALTACVGGPTAYMKSAATEPALSGTVSPDETISAVQPVQSGELPPPGALNTATTSTSTSNTYIAALDPVAAPVQTDNTDFEASVSRVLNGSENESVLAGNGTPVAPAPDQTQIQPTGTAPIMLATAPDSNNQSTTPGVFQGTAPQLAALTTSYAPSGIDSNNSFALGSESAPDLDPMESAAQMRIPALYARVEHGQCKTGKGPTPKKISAKRINPGDPYFIEIRMRRTPLLPVGHTYVAYGRLDPNGNIIDEKLIMLAPVGGYAGAALASGIPMPGVLDPHPDDCRIRPETAYRVSLNAQDYEKLLLEVEKVRSETPSYLLFAYNCNHFATRIAEVVGIRAPKNIYVPALEYIYAMIEENEGRKVARF